jgi:hypothetical protein
MPRWLHQNHSSLTRSSRVDHASPSSARGEMQLAGSEIR